MPSDKEEKWHEPYLRTDLADKDHDRLAEELRADPRLLRELLRRPPDEALSASLLFGEGGVGDQEALDEKLKKYLLHDPAFTPEDTARLEELLVEDERYLERLFLVENELIEDHLRGALSAEEDLRFNSHFLVTPERREKLRYIRALATVRPADRREQAQRPSPQVATSSLWQSLLAFMRPPRRLAAAAAFILLLVAAAVWLTPKSGRPADPLLVENPPGQASQNRNLPPGDKADPSNTVGVNNTTAPSPTPTATPLPTRPRRDMRPPLPARTPHTAPPRTPPPSSVPTVFALVSGVLRGGGDVAEKRIEPGSKIVKLNLRLDLERDYEVYQIVVQDSAGREVARRVRLRAGSENSLPTIVISLPAVLFRPDDYVVILSGGEGRQYSEVDRYSFRVLR